MKIKEYTEFKKDEIWQLYTQVGWTAYTENMTALERGYKNSLLVLAAYENEELLGIVRVLKQPRRTLLLDADHQQNQHGGKILQNGAHTGAGKLDGQKVGELAKADASQAIDHKVARVAPAAPGVHQLAPVAHTVIDAQNHTGQKQPDGHQPGGIHALAGKQILPHAAGNTPAHAAEHCQQSAFYAIRHSL